MAGTEVPFLNSFSPFTDDDNISDPSYNLSSDNTTGIPSKPPTSNMIFLFATMFASGVFGNILAIIVLARSSRDHKQTVFYRLVGALACTDLFGTCAISPISLLVYSKQITLTEGTPLCNYEGFMFIFAGCATIFIIGAMAVDRYLAIRCPFTYEKYMGVGKAKYIIFGLWGFAIFMGCLPIVGLGDIIVQIPKTWCFFTFTSSSLANKIFAYSYSAIGLFVISLTAISNVFVTLTLLKMRRKSRKTFNTCGTKRTDSELQMMVLLLGVVVVFSVCWCPFLIRIIINQVHEEQRDILADLNALKLASLNQILDPWVYILFRKELFIRWFAFLKTRVFGKCLGVCIEGREHSAVLVERRNGAENCQNFARENGVVDNGYTHIKEDNETNMNKNDTTNLNSESFSKRCSTRSTGGPKSDEHNGEEVPLRQMRHERECHEKHVHNRHSACLFCFANNSKNYALTLGDSKSMDNINSHPWPSGDRDLCEMRCIHDRVKDTKRNLSFTDLRLEHFCKCESKEPCISLEC